MEEGVENIGGGEVAPRVSYDPEAVAVVGAFRNRFVQPIRVFEDQGEEYVVVRLTAKGNAALREVCHTSDQRAVWRFPSYEFVVRPNSLSVAQVSFSCPWGACWS